MTSQKRFPKTLIALSLLAVGGAAQAQQQSTVTVYGIMDAAVRNSDGLSNAFVPAAINTSTISSGVNATSRFGFRGREDIGGGLSAFFRMESGVNLATGAYIVPTKFFDRATVLGLEGGWGTLSLGRQTTMLSDTVIPTDPLSMRFANLNPNIAITTLGAHGLGLEYGPSGTTTSSTRMDNSVKYIASLGGLSARVMHAFGTVSKHTSSGAGLDYRSGGYIASLAYSTFNTATGLKLDAYVGGLKADVGAGKISLTYGEQEAETTVTSKTRNRVLGIGGTLPLNTATDLILTHYRVSRSQTAKADDGFNRTVAFLEYKLSKHSLLYAELDQTSWENGYQGAGVPSNATGVSFGIQHQF